MAILLYAGIGIVAGFFSGLLGIGGGIIIVPFLLLVFSWLGLPPSVHLAVGTSLATIIITLCASLQTHLKHSNKELLFKLAKQFILPMILGALLGAYIANLLSSTHLAILFGIIVWLLALRVFLIKNSAIEINQKTLEERLPSKFLTFIINIIISSLAAIMGIGGGGFMVAFLQMRKIPMRMAIPIATLMGIPVAVFGTLSYIVLGPHDASLLKWSTGYVYWPAVFGITLTSIFTAPLGAKVAHRLSNNILRILFAAVLFIIGVKMIF